MSRNSSVNRPAEQRLEERDRVQLAARANDRGAAVAAVGDHRDRVGDHRRATGEDEELAEVVRLDHLAVLDAREPDRPTAPRIVEIAVADVLDHDRDLVVREHEVAGLPRDEPRRHRRADRPRSAPARAWCDDDASASGCATPSVPARIRPDRRARAVVACRRHRRPRPNRQCNRTLSPHRLRA